jgi:hypothetical protein
MRPNTRLSRNRPAQASPFAQYQACADLAAHLDTIRLEKERLHNAILQSKKWSLPILHVS